jgi:predicted transcriptional regulator
MLRDATQLRVADAMKQPVTISPEMTIQQFIDDILPVHRQTSFPVSRQQQFMGVILLERLRLIPQDQWSNLTARDVMLPAHANMLVHPWTPLGVAQSLLRDNDIGCAGVLDDFGNLVGFIGLLEIHKKLVS